MINTLITSINHNLKPVILGMGTSAILGETLKDNAITGNPVADALVKILVPIITGIAIPIVQEIIKERKRKKR